MFVDSNEIVDVNRSCMKCWKIYSAGAAEQIEAEKLIKKLQE
jgi:hypothetical protein